MIGFHTATPGARPKNVFSLSPGERVSRSASIFAASPSPRGEGGGGTTPGEGSFQSIERLSGQSGSTTAEIAGQTNDRSVATALDSCRGPFAREISRTHGIETMPWLPAA